MSGRDEIPMSSANTFRAGFRVKANLRVRAVHQKGASSVVFVGRKKQLVGQKRRGCHFVKNLAFSIGVDK
jgi:hypothetical protein